MMIPVLRSDRLIFRPFTLEDADDVQVLAGHAKIAETTLHIPHPYEDGMAEEWIMSHEEAYKKNKLYHFAIVLEDTNELVGAYTLGVARSGHKAEVGYWVGYPYWGMGICSEATEVMIKYAFETLKVNKVYGRYFVSNPASGRVMEKANMIFEGILREDVKKGEDFHDIGFRSILKREYLGEDR